MERMTTMANKGGTPCCGSHPIPISHLATTGVSGGSLFPESTQNTKRRRILGCPHPGVTSPNAEYQHVALLTKLQMRLRDRGFIREVPCSALKGETVPDSLPCDPQKSPDTPGSPEGNTEGPGTASSEQARTLEWVVISFSNASK